ncbi:response regulator [Streptomyces sp. NPDC052107]|uniref:response regulator n=1 Tax=Streptomyces sp. NPDC052107 TaxID=3155632 RepID=UPI00342492FA
MGGAGICLTDLVVRYLTESGHTAEGRYDGPSGLAAARDPRLDAVLLDVMPPGTDGVEVCRTLRGEGVDVPVILLTARGAISERVAGLDAGADDFVRAVAVAHGGAVRADNAGGGAVVTLDVPC